MQFLIFNPDPILGVSENAIWNDGASPMFSDGPKGIPWIVNDPQDVARPWLGPVGLWVMGLKAGNFLKESYLGGAWKLMQIVMVKIWGSHFPWILHCLGW